MGQSLNPMAGLFNHFKLNKTMDSKFQLEICKVRDVKTPTRGTSLSAGLDFFVPNDFSPAILQPGVRINIPSGIHVNFAKNREGDELDDDIGFASIFFNKSGIAANKGLLVGAEVIDEDYQGEIHINLFNASNAPVTINPGDKIIQLIMIPIAYPELKIVDSLEELYPEISERGEGGFGSTGNN